MYDNIMMREAQDRKELKEYRKLGTVKQLMEAVANKKEIPLPAIKTRQPYDIRIGAITFGAGTIVRKCPVCEEWVTPTMKYCCECGQRLTDK